jgi:hypothetical protein
MTKKLISTNDLARLISKGFDEVKKRFRDIETKMATKADLRDLETRMATKADLTATREAVGIRKL